MALPKTERIEISGTTCTLFTETRWVTLGHEGRARRRTFVTILAGGREIATATKRTTAITRARKALAETT